MGHYDFLLIAPATANTVAKIVYGIADTLVTNTVSQTAKGKTPIFILPVDQKRGTVKTAAPSGRAFELTMREVDVTKSQYSKIPMISTTSLGLKDLQKA